MLISEIVALVEKAQEVEEKFHHQVLRKELAILKNELKHYNKARTALDKEIYEMNCEYYSHEINHTIQLLEG